MRVVSWNVLYRPYEEKYNPRSVILSTYTENERTQRVISFIQQYTRSDTVICLQECSEDLINTIRASLPNNVDLYSQPTSSGDFVVTIIHNGYDFQQEELVHCTAKAYLVISNPKYRIVNCHLVPQRFCNEDVMGFIENFPNDKVTIVAGDFNENYGKVFYRLKHKYTIPKFGNTYRNRSIDFILNTQRIKYNTNNLCIDTSDHNAIVLTF